MMQNGKGRGIRTIIFASAKELVRDARDADEGRAAMDIEICVAYTSLQHEYHHATLGFPLELREWLARQAQGPPRSTRICPSLRCRL